MTEKLTAVVSAGIVILCVGLKMKEELQLVVTRRVN